MSALDFHKTEATDEGQEVAFTESDMGRIVIDEVDDRVIDRLARLAASKRTSLEEQARAMLLRSLPRLDRSDLVRRAEAIAAMTPVDVDQTDSVLILREDRDR